MLDKSTLIACHDCDVLYQIAPLLANESAKCTRCGAELLRHKNTSLDPTIALVITALIAFILANSYPFMTLNMGGREQYSNLISGVNALFFEDMLGLAAVVFLTSILIPCAYLVGLLYVLTALRWCWWPWKIAAVFRFVIAIGPWEMMGVYLLGVFVAIVKLLDLATVIPGISFYAFIALMVVSAAVKTTLDAHYVWHRIGLIQ